MTNYDHLIDWKRFYTERLADHKITGNEIKSRCPFHNDTDPSFTASLETGLYKCYGCDAQGNGIKFLQESMQVDSKAAFAMLNDESGGKLEEHLASTGGKGKAKRKPYTIEDYASAKKIPLEFLKELGLKNTKSGISIPYMDESGSVVSTRQRYGDAGSGPRFTWTRGSKVSLYGLWFLPKIREKDHVILVEGESDSHTLWVHNQPALGVPGASVFRPEWMEYIRDVKKVYVYKEADAGGETFTRKVCEAMVKAKWKGEAYSISMIEHKDPSELHCADPDRFQTYWEKTMEIAEKLDIQETAGGIEEVMKDAPVQLRQPPEWNFNADGIYTINEKTGLPHRVSRTPVLIFRRLQSLDTNQEKIEICFKRDGKWGNVILPRSSLFQAKTITMLADYGVTVTSENARDMVKFLSALESENMDVLDTAKCVSQLGWHGNQFVPGHHDDLVIDIDPSTQKWMDAYIAEGTMDDWKKSIAPMRDNSTFRFLLAASFAAPLLRLLNHRIFIIHAWGTSRIGKTAALKAALSAWGDPDGLMASFYATRVGLERLAGFFRDLPLGVDEKQVTNKNDFLDNMIYMLSLGSSKVRGSRTGGLQASQAWRTIVMTTGEEPLISQTSHAGMHSRVLELSETPFKNEREAQKMHLLKSYGHAGPMFISKILATGVAPLKEKFGEINDTLHQVLEKDDILSTHISASSVIATADYYVSKWLFDEPGEEAFGKALDMAVEVSEQFTTKKDADLGLRTCEFVRDWLLSNIGQFQDGAHNPRYGYEENGRFFIFPQTLKQALEANNFTYRAGVKSLDDHGMIVEGNGGTVLKRFGDYVGRFYVVSLSGLTETEKKEGEKSQPEIWQELDV